MCNLRDYPTGTKVRIGGRVFCKVPPSSFWREEDLVPGNCVSRPSDSLRHIEDELGPHTVIGYFVDWDGSARRVEAPGGGYTCRPAQKAGYLGVDVVDAEGFVCHEAVYYPSIEALRSAGATGSPGGEGPAATNMTEAAFVILQSAVAIARDEQIRKVATLKARLLRLYPGREDDVNQAIFAWAQYVQEKGSCREAS